MQTIVTSPPYWGLRDYGVAGQLGLERDVGEYVDRVVDVFREARRVLRDDGTLWLNIGDTHYTAKGACWNPGGGAMSVHHRMKEVGAIPAGRAAPNRMLGRGRARAFGLKPGDLVMVPARVALALQADGWVVRSDVVWSKPNPMPESVQNRPTRSHEFLFLLTKSKRYFSQFDAIRERSETVSRPTPSGWDTGPGLHDGLVGRYARRKSSTTPHAGGRREAPEPGEPGAFHPLGRNVRSVWEISPEPFPDAHFATFPTELVRRCVLAGTSDRGACGACGAAWSRTRAGDWRRRCECTTDEVAPCVVLDPFAGAGTTLLVADRLGRAGVGLELKPEYVEIARRRIEGDAPMFAAVDVEPDAQERLPFEVEGEKPGPAAIASPGGPDEVEPAL